MKKRIPNAKQKTALLLLLAMLITTLPSCSPKKTGETDATSTKNIPAVEETTPEETEPPINITTEKFSGEDFNIAYMTGGSYGMGNEVDYTFEDSEASAVSSAVYERNLRTEEQLDITINGEFINPTDAYVFNNYVMELVQSGDSSHRAYRKR